MKPAPREALGAVTRQILDLHREWDTLHQFVTLHWDGEKVGFGTVAMIDPAISPDLYPEMMGRLAREEVEREPADNPTLYAFALQFEAHKVVAPTPAADPATWSRFNRDRLERRFRERVDSVEIAQTMTCDIHGRMWWASKARNRPGVVEEDFFAPDAERKPGGGFSNALRALGLSAGVVLYGLTPDLGGGDRG